MSTSANNLPNQRSSPNHPQGSFSIFLLTGVVFVAVLLFLGKAAYDFATTIEVPTGTVELGNTEGPPVYKAIIIRDEKVYTSRAAGSVNYTFGEKSRVKKGAAFCAIQDDEAVEQINLQIDSLNREIMSMQIDRGEIAVFSKDAKRVNQQIRRLIDIAMPHFTEGNVYRMYDLCVGIDENLEVRNQMLLTESKGSVRDSVEQKNAIQADLNQIRDITHAENSGILVYTVDGLENIFKPGTMREITPEQTQMVVSSADAELKRHVDPGDAFCKIVESNTWYIAAYVSTEQIYDWEAEEQRYIFLSTDGEEYVQELMTVDWLEKQAAESFLLLSSNNGMLDYLDARSVSLKFQDGGSQGLKIPANAITNQTLLKIPNEFIAGVEAPFVTRVGEDGVATDVYVQKRDEDEAFCYVIQNFSELKLGDILVKENERDQSYRIVDVKNARGIFLLKQGYFVFTEIDLDQQEWEANGYVILDPVRNKGIRHKDRIAVNAANIHDGQKM